jgi:folylpolyglutamate synthase/dihydropteroate synthase
MFVEAKLDVIVLEVGLGGRLDATNVIPFPVATAVTTLDYDHVELLGDTLAKIAREKAGIFRAGVPAYTCAQEEEAMESLRTVAGEVCMHACSLPYAEHCLCIERLCVAGGSECIQSLAACHCHSWIDALQEVLASASIFDAEESKA